MTYWDITWVLGLILFEIGPFLCMYIIFNVDGDVGCTMNAASMHNATTTAPSNDTFLTPMHSSIHDSSEENDINLNIYE